MVQEVKAGSQHGPRSEPPGPLPDSRPTPSSPSPGDSHKFSEEDSDLDGQGSGTTREDTRQSDQPRVQTNTSSSPPTPEHPASLQEVGSRAGEKKEADVDEAASSGAKDETNLRRHPSAWKAQRSHVLLQAIEKDNVVKVRKELEEAEDQLKAAEVELDEDQKKPAAGSVLTEPSLLDTHSFRTPLMAAAFRGDLEIFTSLLHRFNQRFMNGEPTRNNEMRAQLSIQGVRGNNLVMLAADNGNMPIFKAVMAEIVNLKAWEVLQQSDFEGQTLLMHSARAGRASVFRMIHQILASEEVKKDGKINLCKQMKARSGDGKTILMHAARSGDAMALTEVVLAFKRTCKPSALRRILYETDVKGMNFLMHSAAVFIDDQAAGGKEKDSSAGRASAAPPEPVDGNNIQEAQDVELGQAEVHPSVPVFNIAMDLVTESLWKGQRREQLTAKDFCGRNVLTHALRSGHEQLFEAVLSAVRSNVLDSEVEEMTDVDEENLQNLPLRTAFLRGDKHLQGLFVKRINHLKGDISVRAKLSSIENKIQSFVPGKLIVTFQLMLPETDRQLTLLVVLCVLAPILSWAGALVTNGPRNLNDPRSAVGRKSGVSHMLAAPALFFWGVGTSSIGKELNWTDSFTAAMLAVATIVIPGVDSFFNSPRIELWYEQVTCQENLFYMKAFDDWRRKKSVPFPFGRKPDDTFVMPKRQERVSEPPLADIEKQGSSQKSFFRKIVELFWTPQPSPQPSPNVAQHNG